MARTIELTWTCSSCQTKNLGRYKVCQRCGSPKDASESFEMPGDSRAVASVTDPALLARAHAGRDWRCTYCGFDQLRSDAHCARCGASATTGVETHGGPNVAGGGPAVDVARLFTGFGRGPWGVRSRPSAESVAKVALATGAAAFVVFASCVALAFGMRMWTNRARDIVVASTSWERVVHVDRYRVFSREGFAEARPAGSFDVRSLGPRHHHDEAILDHYETVAYTERVQDGFDTETYTENVACGQDCTSLPESCHEECTDNGNGFASCHDVCSGGGQTCSPRYCMETRTRQVPRFRDDPRTRQEPRYRYEPRSAEWFAWSEWAWGEDRVVRASGHDDRPRWPSADEERLGVRLGEGERERERREARYGVVLRDEDGSTYALTPETEDDFLRYPPRGRLRARIVNGTPMLLGPRDD